MRSQDASQYIPASGEGINLIAQEIIRYYRPGKSSDTQACKDAVADMGYLCHHKTLYFISRGQKPSRLVARGLRSHYKSIFPHLEMRRDEIGSMRCGFKTQEERLKILAEFTMPERRAVWAKAYKDKTGEDL